MPHTAELQRQIEDLAMRLVVDDPAGENKSSDAWLSGLERIQRTATAEHARPVADAAAAMMEAIRAGNDVQVNIPRQSRGPYYLSRSKRLWGSLRGPEHL